MVVLGLTALLNVNNFLLHLFKINEVFVSEAILDFYFVGGGRFCIQNFIRFQALVSKSFIRPEKKFP